MVVVYDHGRALAEFIVTYKVMSVAYIPLLPRHIDGPDVRTGVPLWVFSVCFW